MADFFEKASLDTANGTFLKGSQFDLAGTGDNLYTLQSNSNTTPKVNGNYLSYKDGVLKFTAAGGTWDFSAETKTAPTGSNDDPNEKDKPIGSWTQTTLTDLAFSGAADLKAGAGLKNVNMSDGNDTVNISGSTSLNLDTGKGNDIVSLATTTYASVNLGAGDDTVTGAGGDSTIALGAGKDIVNVTGETVTLTDYNYQEDLLVDAGAPTGLGNDGKMNLSAATVNIATDGDVYTAKVGASAAATEFNYFATAKDGAGTVDVDFSKAAADDTLKVDMTGANSANVSLGNSTAANVTLKSGNESDAITLGKAAAKATVTGFAVTGDKLDKLNVDGASLASLTIGGTDTITLAAGSTSVQLEGVNNTTTGILTLNDKKIAYAPATNLTLDDKVADQFYGFNDGSTVLNISKSHYLTMNEADYKDITQIAIADEAAGVQGIQIQGSKVADTIDVSKTTAGAEVNGGAGNDKITLSTDAASDTLWLGKGAGTDTVSAFASGKGDKADVVYLWDIAKLADVKLEHKFDADASTVTLTAGDGVAVLDKLSVVGADEKSDMLKVKLSDGSTHTVITATGIAGATNVIALDAADQSSADFFVFADAGSSISLSGAEGNSTYIDTRVKEAYTGKLAAINGAENKGNMDIAGVGLVSLGSGTNNVFGAGVDSSVTLKEGEGTDSIWFQSNEKKVSVTNFDAEKDNVWLLDAADLGSVVANYSFALDANGSINIKGKANGATGALTLGGTDITNKPITLKAADGTTTYKAVVKDATADFAADVNIYAGMNEVAAGADVTDMEIKMGLGTEASSIMAGAYGAPYSVDDTLVNFDGSKSSATMIVRGSSVAASSIAGGTKANVLYGGSKDADTLVGGGADAIDTFWWGTADGNDQITQIDKGDIVYLWDVASADLANVTVAASATESSLTIGGSALSMMDNGALFNGGVTVVTSDFKNYVYDQATSSLVEKA